MGTPEQAVADILAKRKGKRMRGADGKFAKRAQVALPPADQFPPDAKPEIERTPDGKFAEGHIGIAGPGRPSLADAILRVLSEDDERTPGRSKVEAVARATVGLAMKGSLGHVQLIIERTDGKVTQPVEVGNKPGEVFKVVDLEVMTPEELAAYESNLVILAAAHARSDDGADASPLPQGAD